MGVREMLSVSPPGGEIAPGSPLREASMGKAPAILLESGKWAANVAWVRPGEITEAELAEWHRWGANVGLRAAKFPALDIDSMDAELVRAVVRYAELELGEAPQRVGRAPKRLLMYRAGDRMTKQVAVVKGPEGESKIEWLATGQQYVIGGTHPSGAEYEWVVRPADVSDLTVVTKEQVDQWFRGLQDALPEGYTITKVHGSSHRDEVADPEVLRAPSVERVKELVEGLPNKPDFGREVWLTLAYAIKGACGAENDEEAFAVWWEWSERWGGGENTFDLCRGTWRGLRNPSVGWEYLEAFARVNEPPKDASDLFADDDLVDRGMRLAAIVGAERVFFMEQGTLRDEDLIPRRLALQKAEQSLMEPLKSPVRKIVYELMKERVIYPVRDMDRARRLLQQHPKFVEESKGRDVGLMLDAALLMMMEVDEVISHASQAKQTIDPKDEHPGIPWLVEGLIPQQGLAGLIGPPGKGKSQIAVALGHAVASPPVPKIEDWPDEPVLFIARELRHGSVIYFAGEDVQGVVTRLRNRGGGALDNMRVMNFVPNLSNEQEAMSDVSTAIGSLSDKSPPVRLLIFDMFIHAMRGDENKVADVRPAMQTALAIARAWKCAILFVHHGSKPNENGKPKRGTTPRGSSAFEGMLDWWSWVDQEEEDPTILMSERKNKHNEMTYEPWPFHVDKAAVLREGRAERKIRVTTDDVLRTVVAIFNRDDPHNTGRTYDQMIRLYAEVAEPGTPKTTLRSRVSAALKLGEEKFEVRAVKKNGGVKYHLSGKDET
jgi:hypothetical protein